MKFYRLSGATFYDCFKTIYQLIKPFLDNEMSIFEEYGAFKFKLISAQNHKSYLPCKNDTNLPSALICTL